MNCRSSSALLCHQEEQAVSAIALGTSSSEMSDNDSNSNHHCCFCLMIAVAVVVSPPSIENFELCFPAGVQTKSWMIFENRPCHGRLVKSLMNPCFSRNSSFCEGTQAMVFPMSDDTRSTRKWLKPDAFERGGQRLSIELSMTHFRFDLVCERVDFVHSWPDPGDHSRIQ